MLFFIENLGLLLLKVLLVLLFENLNVLKNKKDEVVRHRFKN